MSGMKKHARSGHTVNNNHFHGKSGSDSKKKRKSSHKQRKAKSGTHINKYSKK
jgi:hypothetical protein